ncbi:TonB-dependent receptor [Puteibacter caeruleilacunae]|nr:TonB-dependent receptor [Puteibacter caeruleilacunae]
MIKHNNHRPPNNNIQSEQNIIERKLTRPLLIDTSIDIRHMMKMKEWMKTWMKGMMKIFVLMLLVMNCNLQLLAQSKTEERLITIKFENVNLEQALKALEAQTGIHFAYDQKLISGERKYNINFVKKPLKEVLTTLLSPQNIAYRVINEQIILYKKQGTKKVTISGYISDEDSGEKLLYANIFEADTYDGTSTNVYGFYSLTLPAGKHLINFSYVGYQAQEVILDLQNDTSLNVALNQSIALSEVTVVADNNRAADVLNTQMSRVDLPMEKIDKLPALLGEVDVIKSLQLLPGVQAGTEGSSGLYVRGGGPDQNLILLDGVPVYNANHLFGFFSVFNSSAIKTVTLSKGSFPAQFGGRLSSVVDIRMKEGNEKEFHGKVTVGLITSNVNLEGPIVKDKTAFNVSVRRTYADWLARPLIKNASDGDKMGYYFYDLNAKVNHKFSDKDRLYFSIYTGTDKGYGDTKENDASYQSKSEFRLFWSNYISALRWNHIFNNKLFCNTSLTYSKYKFNVNNKFKEREENESESHDFKYDSGITDYAAKIDFDYYPSPSHTVKFGANYINHTYEPGVAVIVEKNNNKKTIDRPINSNDIKTHEYYLYAQDNIEIGSRLKANIGVHYSGFYVQNKLFQSLQPRISMRFLALPKLSFKAAYSKMNQYIHLLSSSTISLPTDLWLPVTPKTGDQNSHQVALGTFYNVKDGIDFSVEGYYKKTNNLIEYKEGASFTDSDNWDDKIETDGEGWSYGLEFLLKKTKGNTTGWIGYTLSWADRQFENLNYGKKYPFRYDRRNDVGIAITHKFSDRFDIGATWVYGTGNAVTFSSSHFNSQNVDKHNGYNTGKSDQLSYYEGRNNYRMDPYHRLDFGMNFHKKKKRGTRTWNVGVYNIYNRKNPYFIYKTDSEKNPKIKQFSLLPLIPSISYSYKF